MKKLYGRISKFGWKKNKCILLTAQVLEMECDKISVKGFVEIEYAEVFEEDPTIHQDSASNWTPATYDRAIEFLQQVCKDGTDEIHIYYDGIRILNSALTEEAATLLRVYGGSIHHLFNAIMQREDTNG